MPDPTSLARALPRWFGPRASADDPAVSALIARVLAGTHGTVASGMQSVAFTPASAIAAVFAATGGSENFFRAHFERGGMR